MTPRDRIVLLVEDEELLLLASSDLLKMGGYQVVTARDGREAWEVFRADPQRIDLILADMGLPMMDGFELFQRVRELRPDVRVIFTTGYIQRARRSEVLAAGVDRVIVKPYSGDEMLRAVEEVLDGTRGVA